MCNKNDIHIKLHVIANYSQNLPYEKHDCMTTKPKIQENVHF